MKLYFLRHGIAVDNAPSGRDFDRALTAEGRERLTRSAKTLAELNVQPDVVVTSPLVRAKQTAEIVADGLSLRDVVADERLGLAFDLSRLARVLEEHRGERAVMLVGHEPSMSATVGRLVGSAALEFKKGSLACVEVPDAATLRGTLLWLIPPKVLAR